MNDVVIFDKGDFDNGQCSLKFLRVCTRDLFDKGEFEVCKRHGAEKELKMLVDELVILGKVTRVGIGNFLTGTDHDEVTRLINSATTSRENRDYCH